MLPIDMLIHRISGLIWEYDNDPDLYEFIIALKEILYKHAGNK